MAIYSFSGSMITRSKGQSALQLAAYIDHDQLTDEYTGLRTRSFKGRGELILPSFLVTPKNTPRWTKRAQTLWSEVERIEKRKNSQLARSFIIALPHELKDSQQKALITNFLREAFVDSHGLIAHVAMHKADKHGNQLNDHVHVMVTTRRIEQGRFAKHKARELNNPELMAKWRKLWADHSVAALQKAGHPKQAEEMREAYRSLEAQRMMAQFAGKHKLAEWLDRKPGSHLGPIVVNMQRRGVKTNRQVYDEPIIWNGAIVEQNNQPRPSEDRSYSIFERMSKPSTGKETLREAARTMMEPISDKKAAPDLSVEEAREDVNGLWQKMKFPERRVVDNKKVPFSRAELRAAEGLAQEFRTAVEDAGYKLRRGHSRNFVVETQDGKVINLERLVRNARIDEFGKERSTVKKEDVAALLESIQDSIPYLGFDAVMSEMTAPIAEGKGRSGARPGRTPRPKRHRQRHH